MKRKILLLSILLWCLLSLQGFSQTIFSEDFESGGSEWTIVNGTEQNYWIIGSDANAVNAGTKAAYITNDSSTYGYNNSSTSVVHLYRDITIPAGKNSIELDFDWKAFGEACCDRLSVFLIPVDETPQAGDQLQEPIAQLNNQSGWQHFSLSQLVANINTTMRLVFSWRNDYSVGDTPIAIDNIVVKATTIHLDTVISFTTPVNIHNNNSRYIDVVASGSSPVMVDWGDGKINSYQSTTTSYYHNYDNNGTYTVTVLAADTTFLSIDVRYEDITSLNVSKNKALTELIADHNMLTAIDLTKNTQLISLDIQNNKLTAVNLRQNTLLEYADISYNYLSSLDLSQNSNLTELYATNNSMPLNVLHSLPTTISSVDLYTQYLGIRKTALNTPLLITADTLFDGYSTYYEVYNNAKGTFATLNADYTLSRNTITFLKDGVYDVGIYNDGVNGNAYQEFIAGNLAKQNISWSWSVRGSKYLSLEIPPMNAFSVNWGDGTIDTLLSANTSVYLSHYYDYEGIFNVTLSGLQENCLFKELGISDQELTALNVSNAPTLTYLNCRYNNLTSLDLTKNTALQSLYCAYNQLKSLDVSKDTVLQYLYCNNNNLKSLDCRQNKRLESLSCCDNELTSLILSGLENLQTLQCENNALSHLDAGSLNSLQDISCENNALSLSELYALSEKANGYKDLGMQVLLGEQAVALNTPILITSDTSINGTPTIFPIVNNMDNTAQPGIDYTIANNYITFLRNGIYVVMMANPAIASDEDPPTVVAFFVAGNPEKETITFTWKTSSNLDKTFKILASVPTRSYSVNWGDGNIDTILCSESNKSLSHHYSNKNQSYNVIISGLDFATIFSTLNVEREDVSALNVSKAPFLEGLNCEGNKNLKQLDVSKNTGLENLSISGCLLDSLNITQNTLLEQLLCNGNNLKQLNTSNNNMLEQLYCSSNLLSSLDITANTALTDLDCENNMLSLTELYNISEQLTGQTYVLGEQTEPTHTVALNTPVLIISDTVINSSFTTFIVTRSNGTAQEGIDYTINRGYITFTTPDVYFVEAQNSSIITYFSWDYPVVKTTFIAGNVSIEKQQISFVWKSGIEAKYLELSMLTSGKTYTINWGDGTTENFIGKNYTEHYHSYANTNNNYTVVITGSVNDCFISSINIGKENVSSINLTKVPTLEHLHISENNISTLDLSHNELLKEINANNNQLTTLDLSNNTDIQYIYLEKNNLTSLNTGANPFYSLSRFYCDSNALSLKTLYDLSIVTPNYSRVFGPQLLPPAVATLNIPVVMTNDTLLNSISTQYVVKKGSAYAVQGTDYTISNNKITFKQNGLYTVTMTNAAIVAYNNTKVLKTFAVGVSNDATLSNLIVSAGTLSPAFSATNTSYTVNVPADIENIIITGTANNAHATVDGNGQKLLSSGNNVFRIIVTAEDRVTTKTYTITVTRGSNPNPDPDPVPDGVTPGKEAPQLAIYPNPTTGVFILEGNKIQGEKCEIYSLMGKLAATYVLESNKAEINISQLPSGMYFVKINEYVVKIVKK